MEDDDCRGCERLAFVFLSFAQMFDTVRSMPFLFLLTDGIEPQAKRMAAVQS
ncbi:hypothetical protein BJX68DRAFT_246155 [Aspergillus pseudodeflectus]|uniref:Uncharacterized protein n=1 Tax=Aspergillus pseudodeflectus TaxID=176178 RepID=A0ABR4JM89_9EURO